MDYKMPGMDGHGVEGVTIPPSSRARLVVCIGKAMG
jgi:hypothetical protein